MAVIYVYLCIYLVAINIVGLLGDTATTAAATTTATTTTKVEPNQILIIRTCICMRLNDRQTMNIYYPNCGLDLTKCSTHKNHNKL